VVQHIREGRELFPLVVDPTFLFKSVVLFGFPFHLHLGWPIIFLIGSACFLSRPTPPKFFFCVLG